MSEAELLRREAEGVAWLVLNRPAARNALSRSLKAELEAALEEIAAREDLHVVVLTGVGDRAFCAGNDIRERAEDGNDAAEAEAFTRDDHRLADALEALPQPVICAINGAAMGGGLELALACDIRLAPAGAALGLPEAKIGAMPSIGGTQRLARLVGPGAARRMAYSGAPVTAEAALAMGLVEEVAEDGEALQAAAAALAAAVAANAPGAVRRIKAAMRIGESDGPAAGREAEIRLAVEVNAMADRREGMRAFLEKRPPRFTGR
ncbi:MAG: enoyl-CoA hydratase-related protein [Pseudomonadota bacterium]